MAIYWLVAGVFLLGFLLIHRIVHSPFGQVLKAIRENEPRAISLGYRTDDYKLHRLRALDLPRRRRRRHEGAGVRHRHADRRALVDVAARWC